MAQSAPDVIRDVGQLTLGATALGFTSAEVAGLNLFVEEEHLNKHVEERGRSPIGVYFMGVLVYGWIDLAQRDANALQAAFREFNTAGTVAIDLDTIIVGTDLAQDSDNNFALSWDGTHYDISAPKVVSRIRRGQPMFFGSAKDNTVPLYLGFYPDTNNLVCTIAPA